MPLRQEATSNRLTVLLVVWRGRQKAQAPLSWIFVATCRLPVNGIWTLLGIRTLALSASPPPALGTSHLSAQQPASGSLALRPSWPFPFVALRAVCCESNHWATRCLQKSPLWQLLFIPAKAAEKAGHRARGTRSRRVPAPDN